MLIRMSQRDHGIKSLHLPVESKSYNICISAILAGSAEISVKAIDNVNAVSRKHPASVGLDKDSRPRRQVPGHKPGHLYQIG